MVTSLAEVWIEIVSLTGILTFPAVTSLAEVWIEICPSPSGSLSLSVTSLAEVWIEMQQGAIQRRLHLVTSLAEVWIEIVGQTCRCSITASLPLRKCGLKLSGDAGILRTG